MLVGVCECLCMLSIPSHVLVRSYCYLKPVEFNSI